MTNATMPKHFWKHDVQLAAIRAGADAEWLRARFNDRMSIWYNAGETIDGAVEMILFTWRQQPIEERAEVARRTFGAIRETR